MLTSISVFKIKVDYFDTSNHIANTKLEGYTCIYFVFHLTHFNINSYIVKIID